LNYERPNTGNCKKHGIAFGEAVLMSSPPSRSQIYGQAKRQSFAESGFGGWADEKIKTAREAAPRLARKKSHPQHLTISPFTFFLGSSTLSFEGLFFSSAAIVS